MKAITVSDLRANLKTHLNEVSRSSQTIIIPRNNRAEDAVVVMSIGEYNSIKETEYLTSSSANVERLRESIKELEAGQVTEFDLDQFLEE